MGRSVHPQHRHVLRREGQAQQPLLVPAHQQHQHLVQHEGGAPRQQGRPPGIRLRHRPPERVAEGRVRLQPRATRLASPTFDSWIDQTSDKYGYKFDTEGGASCSGPVTKDSLVLPGRSGKRPSFIIIDIAGYTDWAAPAGDPDNLKQAGIEPKPRTQITLLRQPSGTQWHTGREHHRPEPLLRAATPDSATSARSARRRTVITAGQQPGGRRAVRPVGATTDTATKHDLISRSRRSCSRRARHPRHRRSGLVPVLVEGFRSLAYAGRPVRVACALESSRLGGRAHARLQEELVTAAEEGGATSAPGVRRPHIPGVG